MGIIKNKKIVFCILLVLVFIAGVCIYKYIGSGSQEIKTAKKYVSTLIDENLIQDDVDIKKCSSVQKSDPSKTEKYYSVTVDNYAIDIDAKYNVLGFSNKNATAKSEAVTEQQARQYAEEYIKRLYDGESQYKDTVKEEDSQKVPYYTFVFSKCKKGIPLYSYNLSLKINKENGKVDGFSDSSINIEPKDAVETITEEDARNTVKETFSKLNTFINFDDNTYKYYCEDKDKTELELCYVVSVKGLDSSSKEVRMKYFVSTESGEIINSEKNNV